MTFQQEYKALEGKFKEQISKDNKRFGWKGQSRSYYLPNLTPKGPVDFVLVAMEPSDGAKSKDGKLITPRNFIGYPECFVLHHCVQRYLCDDGQTYHITDLAKGAMPTKQAKSTRVVRWPGWYPLLEQEIELVAKSDAPVIAVGNQVENFLNGANLARRVRWIPHYSRQVFATRSIAPRLYPGEYEQFAASVGWDDIESTARELVRGKAFTKYRDDILDKRPKGPVSDSYKMLMFTYKKLFAVIGGEPEASRHAVAGRQ